jgi:hypothetical protein
LTTEEPSWQIQRHSNHNRCHSHNHSSRENSTKPVTYRCIFAFCEPHKTFTTCQIPYKAL